MGLPHQHYLPVPAQPSVSKLLFKLGYSWKAAGANQFKKGGHGKGKAGSKGKGRGATKAPAASPKK